MKKIDMINKLKNIKISKQLFFSVILLVFVSILLVTNFIVQKEIINLIKNTYNNICVRNNINKPSISFNLKTNILEHTVNKKEPSIILNNFKLNNNFLKVHFKKIRIYDFDTIFSNLKFKKKYYYALRFPRVVKADFLGGYVQYKKYRFLTNDYIDYEYNPYSSTLIINKLKGIINNALAYKLSINIKSRRFNRPLAYLLKIKSIPDLNDFLLKDFTLNVKAKNIKKYMKKEHKLAIIVYITLFQKFLNLDQDIKKNNLKILSEFLNGDIKSIQFQLKNEKYISIARLLNKKKTSKVYFKINKLL